MIEVILKGYTISDHENFSDVRFEYNDMGIDLTADVFLSDCTFELGFGKDGYVKVTDAKDIKNIMVANNISLRSVLESYGNYSFCRDMINKDIDLFTDKFRELLVSEILAGE